jgi:hypothetical protein
MNSMNAPKILPWIARKAGISDELALKLWRRAVSEAEYLTGKPKVLPTGAWRRALPVHRRGRSRQRPVLQSDPGPANVLDVASPDPHVPALAAATQNAYRYWQNTLGNIYPQKKRRPGSKNADMRARRVQATRSPPRHDCRRAIRCPAAQIPWLEPV